MDEWGQDLGRCVLIFLQTHRNEVKKMKKLCSSSPHSCAAIYWGPCPWKCPCWGCPGLGHPVPWTGAGLWPPSTCRHSMKGRLEQTQNRKLGFFQSLVIRVHVWAGAWTHATEKEILLYWCGRDKEANPCEGIFSPFVISACSPFAISASSPLLIEGFILVLIRFQRKLNINKISYPVPFWMSMGTPLLPLHLEAPPLPEDICTAGLCNPTLRWGC